MKNSPLKVIATFIIFVGIVAAMGFAINDGLLDLKEIKISMATDDLEKSSEALYERVRVDLSPVVNAYLGKSMWSVDLEDLLAVVKKDPRVGFARVYRRLPNRLELEVFPRKAMMAILGKSGELFPVSADGRLLPELLSSEIGSLPILRGQRFLKNKKLIIVSGLACLSVFMMTQTFLITATGAFSSSTLLDRLGQFVIKDLWYIANLVVIAFLMLFKPTK